MQSSVSARSNSTSGVGDRDGNQIAVMTPFKDGKDPAVLITKITQQDHMFLGGGRGIGKSQIEIHGRFFEKINIQ